MSLPFKEELVGEFYMRTFSEDVDAEELKWHTDPEDRIVEATHDTDWQVQLEDGLPFVLNKSVFIPKGVWHRVIKGTGDLNIKLQKLK